MTTDDLKLYFDEGFRDVYRRYPILGIDIKAYPLSHVFDDADSAYRRGRIFAQDIADSLQRESYA